MPVYNTPQKLSAEFIGTFALVFFGAGAICMDHFLHGAGNPGLLGIALAAGLSYALLVSTLGHVSGGHFNPAVTTGLWVIKRFSTLDTVLYWLAQLGGAASAAFLLKALVPEDAWRAVALGTPDLARDLPMWNSILLEAIVTFFLVLAVFAATVDEKAAGGKIAGLGVGFAAAVGTLVAWPLTGAALNPARFFGPALASHHWANQGVYWLGPLAGGFAAGLVYDSLFLKKG
jgi:glycerol uptake facilitator protein